MTLFQIIFVPVCALGVGLALVRMMRGAIGRRTGVFWLAVWSCAGVLIIRPSLTSVAATWLGIGRGTDLVMYLAVIAGMIVSLNLYSRSRKLESLVTGLMRRETLHSPRFGSMPETGRSDRASDRD